ncbi:fimbrial assembly family protein [Candidatus Magnetomorum sp. HK-1]|nr:fimbrial assembly family protein [Candidatus Magnetomorum sp. HK-1]
MIRINLQTEYQSYGKVENLITQLVLFGICLFLVLGCLQYYYAILQDDINSLEQEGTQKQAQINRYKQTIRKVDVLKARLATIEKKLSIIKQLSTNRIQAIFLLNAITGSVVSKRMWFSSIDYNNSEVNIQGLAMDERTVTDFMKKLEEAKNWIWISDAFIKDLKTKNIPESIILKISDLKDFQFFQNQEFEFVLDVVLGDQITEKDKEAILIQADKAYFSEVKLISTAKRTIERHTHLTSFIINCSQNKL